MAAAPVAAADDESITKANDDAMKVENAESDDELEGLERDDTVAVGRAWGAVEEDVNMEESETVEVNKDVFAQAIDDLPDDLDELDDD